MLLYHISLYLLWDQNYPNHQWIKLQNTFTFKNYWYKNEPLWFNVWFVDLNGYIFYCYWILIWFDFKQIRWMKLFLFFKIRWAFLDLEIIVFNLSILLFYQFNCNDLLFSFHSNCLLIYWELPKDLNKLWIARC